MHDEGETDMRGCYCAIAVASMLHILTDELMEGIPEYICRCQTWEGGIAGEEGLEAHGGYSYCGLATLCIAGKADALDLHGFLKWAVHKQMTHEGGFQGRANKLVDSCYSFWQGAIFPLLHEAFRQGGSEKVPLPKDHCWFAPEPLQMYLLLACQHPAGGLRDKPNKSADFYHTCYALSGVRIGLVIDGEMRPLAPDGCSDMATQEETTLLDEDIEVSDVRPPGPGQLARIPLCAHHRQVYQGAAAKRKCGVLTCHKASKGARHGVPLCYDHLCEQGSTGARKDSPHPNGMLQGFRRRFTRRPPSRSRSPAIEQAQERVPEEASERRASQSKKESGMAPMRSSSVDLGKVMIPSPPRGTLDQEDVMGKPVWVKIKLNYTDEKAVWVMCLGELVGYIPGGVRGDRKLEIFIKFLEATIIVDPKYLDDLTEVKNVEDVEPEKAQHLIREVPQDAAGIGLDVKGYIVPEHLVQRLRSWEGRVVEGGKRLNQSQIDHAKKNISNLVRRHCAGYIKGEIWPSWPAEAELGMDLQVRGRTEHPPLVTSEETRRRSRSRSHSLARIMKEEDERKQRTEHEVVADAETEDLTGEGIVEAFVTATTTGQTHQEAMDTVQMIFEADAPTIQGVLRNYIRKNCGKQNEQVEVAIKILKGTNNQSTSVSKDDNTLQGAQLDRPKPMERKPTSFSDKLFPQQYGIMKDDGSLIRPAGSPDGKNPLTANDGVVGQLFGLGGRLDDTSTRAGAGGDDEDGQMGARVVHALEGIRKATEGDKKGSPGTRSSIGSEESLDVYLARGCNTLTVEVCPDVTGKELFDALKRACSHAKAKLQQIEWPCLVTNGIAYGLAALQHGGKDHTTLAPWQLSVAHAVTAKPRDFDQYEAPKDDKIEPKPRYPTHFATWLKQARNEIKMLGSVLGLEHKKERLKALDQIERAHEQDSDVWPENYCYSLWEELKAAWVEELRESRRQLCRILNTDNPRKEDLKWVAINLTSTETAKEVMRAAMKIELAEAKAEHDEKVKDGVQKQGWLPPEEYEGVQYTQLEDELRELTRDPMLEPGHKCYTTWDRRVEHPEALRRLKVLEEMEKAGTFARLNQWSSYLQSHVRGRMLNAVIEKQEMTVDEVLLEATEKGCPELAQEAEKVLNEERSVGWVDDEKQAWISAPTWYRDKGYGEGKFEFQCGDKRISWRYLDYKDKLPVSDELASALGLQPGEDEERQCLVLHPAAGILLWEGDWDPERRPTIEEVKQKAQSFRAGLWDEAARAVAELGDPAPWIGAREAEVRGYAHDCLRANHDKDYRLFQAFVLDELREVTLQCWRLNCCGQFQVDHLVGSQPGSEGQIIPFLIHGGHIRLLVPNEKEEPIKVAAELTLNGQVDREWQCEGCWEFLANEDTAAPLVPGKRPKCPRCLDNNPKQGKGQPQVPWSFNEHPVDTQELILMGARTPLKHRPSFAYGVRVQEVFAGSGTWTQAMREAGMAANEPVELFGDPLQKQDRRSHFDLKDEAVANYYLQAAAELPGPSTANVWEFGTPCTSYCDFNILNGGTRSFTSPEGGPDPTKSEEEGNYFCELTCRMCELLYAHDKEFVLESSMPSECPLAEEPEMKIAIAELLCYAGLAAAESHGWHGELVAYATDNQNVRSWLTKRQSKCAIARHIIRILGMLEVRYHFKTVAFYIRTYHNVTADWLSRETKKVVEDKMELDGWIKVDVKEDWGHYIDESVAGIFRWPGGEALGSLTQAVDVVHKPYCPIVATGCAVELGRGRLPWAIAWDRLGGQVCKVGQQGTPMDEKLEESNLKGSAPLTDETDLVWVFGSRTYIKQFVKKHLPANVLIDIAKGGPVEEIKNGLMRLSYIVHTFDCLTTHYGDPAAKRKVIILGSRVRKGETIQEASMPPRRAAEPTSIQRTLDPAVGSVRPQWLDPDTVASVNHKISTSGDRALPWPAGHFASSQDGETKELIYDIRGPALTCRRGKSMIVLDHRGAEVQARRLGAEEEWLLNGGRLEDVHMLHELGTKQDFFKKDAAMKFPQQSAHRLVAWFERWRQDRPEADPAAQERVGVCFDADRAKADEQVKAWMRAWQGDHQNPRASYERSGGSSGASGVYLTGETKDERKADEDELLRFMTYLAHVMQRTEGTVKQRLFAIKMGHLVAGHDDPTLNRVRIWAALNGFKRWQPETKRKYPVLPGMLVWIRRHLSSCDTLSKGDQVILWAAIMVGFFFLLRASEFLVTVGRSWGSTRTLKGSDIEARKDNMQVTNFHQAEEVVIYLKGSKTDQYNQGTVRNQFKSGNELCVVSALADYQNIKPERFAGAEENQPLFRFEDGKPLQRGDIQNLIQLAAVADGQSTTRYGSHSLRIGGATAMYQTTKDLDVVKRFGRWNSDAFHGYLWESHERQRDLAKGMAGADGQLLAPRKNKGYEAAPRHQEKPKQRVADTPTGLQSSMKVGSMGNVSEDYALGNFGDEDHGGHGYDTSDGKTTTHVELYGEISFGWKARPKRLRSTNSDFGLTAKDATVLSSALASSPRFDLKCELEPIKVLVSAAGYRGLCGIMSLVSEYFAFQEVTRHWIQSYWPHRPLVHVHGNSILWWRYALRCIRAAAANARLQRLRVKLLEVLEHLEASKALDNPAVEEDHIFTEQLLHHSGRPKRLMVITDFDQTLTTYFGKDGGECGFPPQKAATS
eukprot:g24517.t1